MGENQVLNQLEPWSELKDKVVLLTGASSGIGREVCLDLDKAGCKIIAAARRVDRLEFLCSEINSLSSTGIMLAAPFELDVSSDAATIQKAVKQAWDIFGKIDVLINNAGIRSNVKTCLDLSEDEWDRVFRTNLTGAWLVSKYVCSLMRDAKRGGSVINRSLVSIQIRLVHRRSPPLYVTHWSRICLTIPLKVQQTMDLGITSLVRYLIHDSSRYVSGNIYILDSGATIPGLPIISSL
ncbi:unnamed protein product [Brassica oleracea]